MAFCSCKRKLDELALSSRHFHQVLNCLHKQKLFTRAIICLCADVLLSISDCVLSCFPHCDVCSHLTWEKEREEGIMSSCDWDHVLHWIVFIQDSENFSLLFLFCLQSVYLVGEIWKRQFLTMKVTLEQSGLWLNCLPHINVQKINANKQNFSLKM